MPAPPRHRSVHLCETWPKLTSNIAAAHRAAAVEEEEGVRADFTDFLVDSLSIHPDRVRITEVLPGSAIVRFFFAAGRHTQPLPILPPSPHLQLLSVFQQGNERRCQQIVSGSVSAMF